jgi:hypothetical protein
MLNVNPKYPCFCRPLAFSQLKVKTKKDHCLDRVQKKIEKAYKYHNKGKEIIIIFERTWLKNT